MNKVKHFSDLTACRALIFLSNSSNIDEVNLAKETAKFISASLSDVRSYCQEIQLIQLF